MKKIEIYAPLVGRVLLAGLFILAGLNKIGIFSGVQAYMEAFGLPGSLLAPTIAFEVVAGLALVVGWQVRMIAFLLAGFSVLSALVFHTDFGDPNQFTHLLKNFSIAGGMLMLALHGAGAISLDARNSSQKGV
jgi:putative oxidoreductase